MWEREVGSVGGGPGINYCFEWALVSLQVVVVVGRLSGSVCFLPHV